LVVAGEEIESLSTSILVLLIRESGRASTALLESGER
jgi:hypothetical protein